MKTELLSDISTVVWQPQDELEDPAHLNEAVDEVRTNAFKTVLLDLSEKEWLSSSEIGVIMWAFKELEGIDAELTVIAASPFVMKTITLTGIDKLLPVFDSREKALHQITSSG